MSLLFPTAWDGPSSSSLAPVVADPQSSKKRKRNAGGGAKEDDINLKSVEVNIEKLMKQMHEEDVKGAKDKQEKKEKWENKKNQGKTREREGEKERMGKKGGEGGRNTPMGKGQKDVPNQKSTPNIRQSQKTDKSHVYIDTTHAQGKNKQKHKARQNGTTSPSDVPLHKLQERPAKSVDSVPRPEKKKKPRHSEPALPPTLAPHSVPAHTPRPPAPAAVAGTNSKLTPLQAKMKASLSGARFRWINEQLYTSSASSAHELMRSQPNLYEDYHAGFAAQLVGWPTPPLDALAVLLQKLPKTALIADLGSGPGTLAKKLVPQGRKVLSFDLHPDDWVTEADFCERIPLPGSEGEESGAIVDACVCCLSLMGTDWICGVREARRVLVANGQLLVAEVTSRFTDVSNFVQVIESVGFRMTKKDDGDTHFMLFVFEKVDKDLEEWEEVVQRAEGLLKPCEYKRR